MSSRHTLEAIRPIEPTIRQEVDALGDGVMETVNLLEEDTGIRGVIFVSTRMASHGPRVKYLQKAGEDQKSFSVSIADPPEVRASSLPDKVVSQMSPAVIAWVQLNKSELLRLWTEGNTLSKKQMFELLNGLRKLPV